MAKRTRTIPAPSLVAPSLCELSCSKCDRLVENVRSDVKAIICAYCVAHMVEPPELPKHLQKSHEEPRPKGWHKRENYVSSTGKAYRFGREVDESAASNSRSVGRDLPKGTVKSAPSSKRSVARASSVETPSKLRAGTVGAKRAKSAKLTAASGRRIGVVSRNAQKDNLEVHGSKNSPRRKK